MAHSEKESYQSYPRDAFDNPPSGPVGVHRGRRSVVARVAPFLIVIVAAALAGLLAWGIASGELAKVQLPWSNQSQTSQSDAGDDGQSDDQDASDSQQSDQSDQSDQTDGAQDEPDGDDQSQDGAEPAAPEQTVNYGTGVRVVNATGVNGYAAQQMGVLQSVGYTNVVAANPSGGTLPAVNVVWYQNETDMATAQDVANTLGIATVEQTTGISDPIVVVYIAAQ